MCCQIKLIYEKNNAKYEKNNAKYEKNNALELFKKH